MLPEKVYIFNPASIGSGQYTFELYFQTINTGQYLNIGDHVQDTVGNIYEIIAPTSLPHTDGAVVTTQFITTDVLPFEDADYDSTAFTPNQIDIRPAVRTSGSLANPSLYSGPNYEYDVLAGWDLPAEADKAIVGDRIVDLNGKEYEISFIDAVQRFNIPIRVIEVVKEAVTPQPGEASMFRATINYGFFQGTPITDPARTVVRNKDDFNIDLKIKQLEDLIASSGSGNAIITTGTNQSGGLVTKATPVRASSGDGFNTVDVSSESDINGIIGVVASSLANGANGNIVTDGRLEDIPVSAAVGASVWIDKSGNLTTTGPDVGVNGFVAGDFVVLVGTIAENKSNPSLRDLIVDIDIITQL